MSDHPPADPARVERAHFDRAYEENWQAVFRFAAAWTNDRDAAEDIAQDAFVRLWGHRATFDWSEPALPWLLVTARRLAASRFRVLKRLVSFALAGPTVHELTVGDAGSPGVDRWIDARKAMARLTPRERAALVGVGLMGLSTAEVGRALGVSEGAVRALISRARARLGAEA